MNSRKFMVRNGRCGQRGDMQNYKVMKGDLGDGVYGVMKSKIDR